MPRVYTHAHLHTRRQRALHLHLLLPQGPLTSGVVSGAVLVSVLEDSWSRNATVTVMETATLDVEELCS